MTVLSVRPASPDEPEAGPYGVKIAPGETTEIPTESGTLIVSYVPWCATVAALRAAS